MAVVKVEKNTYKVGALYQWGKNQVLQIYGLSLPSIPEIHFSNKTMSNAIVKQASMDRAGVVSVDIPNVLLEQPHDIIVYVCTYEGDAFQCLYKMTIPVNAKKKPDDYVTPPDNTEEVYSFNALENLFVNSLTRSVENYEQAKADYDRMSGEISKATATLETATEALNKATADFDTAKSELDQAKQILEEASGDLNEAADNYNAALNAYNLSAANLNEVVAEYNNAKAAYEAARTLYEQSANSFLQLSGGTMAGDINMGGKAITNVADPQNDTDAVNKKYVDENNGGLDESMIVNNFTTTEPGYVADARALKVLNDKIFLGPDIMNISTHTTLTNAVVTELTADKSGYYRVTANTGNTAVECQALIGLNAGLGIIIVGSPTINDPWLHLFTEFIYLDEGDVVYCRASGNADLAIQYAPPKR